MTQRVEFAALVLMTMFVSVCAFSQSLPDIESVKDLPATESPSPKYQRLAPLSIDSQAVGGRAATIQQGTFGLPFNRANIISAPSFAASFISRGQTWQLNMMGTAPWNGASTTIPAHIVAVSLRLQNANLVTFTNVSVAPFITPTLNSPNFQAANYSTGAGIQFGDAVQRAEFFHKMKARLAYEPASGYRCPQRYHHRAALYHRQREWLQDASADLFLRKRPATGIRQFFFWTSFLISKFSTSWRMKSKQDDSAPTRSTSLFSPTPSSSLSMQKAVWETAAPWDSTRSLLTRESQRNHAGYLLLPAGFLPASSAGFQDVTALSHEISESLNDPFVDNQVPAWQYPNEPGTCQDNLETGDPVEVLSNPSFPVHVSGMTYHPQTEALLQWFEQKSTSTAINSAFSYPNTKALTHGATAFGPLTCP